MTASTDTARAAKVAPQTLTRRAAILGTLTAGLAGVAPAQAKPAAITRELSPFETAILEISDLMEAHERELFTVALKGAGVDATHAQRVAGLQALTALEKAFPDYPEVRKIFADLKEETQKRMPRLSDEELLAFLLTYRGDDPALRGVAVIHRISKGVAEPGEFEEALALTPEASRSRVRKAMLKAIADTRAEAAI